MSVSFSTLVEFVDGKPKLAIGARSGSKEVTRSYTRPGDATAYREFVLNPDLPPHCGGSHGRDIRIVKVTIPDLTPMGDTIWPNLVPQLAVSWS